MQRPPRPPKESIFAHGMWQHILWVGLLMGAVTLLTQAWALHNGSAHWQTMVFTVLTLSQLGHVLAIRSERESLFTQGVFSNRMLVAALALTFALQMAVLYVPWLNPIFKTAPLSAGRTGGLPGAVVGGVHRRGAREGAAAARLAVQGCFVDADMSARCSAAAIKLQSAIRPGPTADNWQSVPPSGPRRR